MQTRVSATCFTLSVSNRSSYNQASEVHMKYRIALHKSDEGFSVSVPGLPGCWSQGETEQEALENIREAIREYLSVVDDQLRGEETREIEVAG
jgi:predicted RNase H-like HicB family nuclease